MACFHNVDPEEGEDCRATMRYAPIVSTKHQTLAGKL
jgi:hypothetical protein